MSDHAIPTWRRHMLRVGPPARRERAPGAGLALIEKRFALSPDTWLLSTSHLYRLYLAHSSFPPPILHPIND